MESLIFEMEKLLVSGNEDCSIQDIIGEFAGKTIDDLLIEADKIIDEILPYFQTTSKPNKVKTSTDFESIKANTRITTTQPKPQQNSIKKVVFNSNNNFRSIYIPEQHPIKSEIYGKLATNKYIMDEESEKKKNCSSSLNNCTTPEFKVPEVNFMKTQLQASSTMLENHNGQKKIMFDKHDKLTNNFITQDKLKMEEELNYYRLRNNELEKNLTFKEQEIRNWENRYQKLNEYCETFLKKNIQETLKSYECQLNELYNCNMTRESQLHTIICNLLEEIDQTHLQYRIKLTEKNKQIQTYLDGIERILHNVYVFRNNNTKR